MGSGNRPLLMLRRGTLPREPVDALGILCGLRVSTVRHLCWTHRAAGGRLWWGGRANGGVWWRTALAHARVITYAPLRPPLAREGFSRPLPLRVWLGGGEPSERIVPPPPCFFHTCRRRGMDQPPRAEVSNKNAHPLPRCCGRQRPALCCQERPTGRGRRGCCRFLAGGDWAGAVQIGERRTACRTGPPVGSQHGALQPLASRRELAPARPRSNPWSVGA